MARAIWRKPALITSVEQMQKQRIHSGRSPRAEALQTKPYLGIRLTDGVQQRLEQLSESGEASDLRFDIRLGGKPVESGLLRCVDVRLFHSRIALDKIEPEQLFQLGA